MLVEFENIPGGIGPREPGDSGTKPLISERVEGGLRPVLEVIGHTHKGDYSYPEGYRLAREVYWSNLRPYITSRAERQYVGMFFRQFPEKQRPLVMTSDQTSKLNARYNFKDPHGDDAIAGLRDIISGKDLGDPYFEDAPTPISEIADILQDTFGSQILENTFTEALQLTDSETHSAQLIMELKKRTGGAWRGSVQGR